VILYYQQHHATGKFGASSVVSHFDLIRPALLSYVSFGAVMQCTVQFQWFGGVVLSSLGTPVAP
jgi:hypothetical protein